MYETLVEPYLLPKFRCTFFRFPNLLLGVSVEHFTFARSERIYMPKFLLITLLLCTTVAQSQTILRNISDAHQLAMHQNPGVLSSNIQEKMARFDRKSVGSAYLPSIQAQAQSDYNVELPVQLIPTEIFGGPAGGFQEVRFGRPYNSSASIDFSQPILQADKLAQIVAARHTEKQGQLEQQFNRVGVLQSVSRAYFSVLILRESLQINRNLDSTAQVLYLNTKARYAKELLSKIDLNRSENLWLQMHQQTLKLEAELQIALKQLSTLLNIADEKTIQIDDQLQNYSNSVEVERVNPEQRLSYLAAKEAEAAAKWRWKQQSWSRLPKLSLNSRYTFASQGDTWLGNGSNNFQFGTIGLSLSVPLVKGGNQHWQSRKSQLGFEMSQLQTEQALFKADAELQDWLIKSKERSVAAELAKRRDLLSAESLKLSLLSYEQGVVSLTEVFNAYNEHSQARNAWVQAAADATLYRLLLDLEKVK